MPRFVLRVVLLFMMLAGAPVAFAATADEAAPEAGAPAYARAAVTLDGEVLFHVRGSEAFPAEERARGVSERIRAIAADDSIPVESLRTVDLADRTNLLAGEKLIMSVFDADAAPEGIPRQLVAELQHRRIALAIQTYRHDRTPRVLMVNTAYAIGATLVFALLVFVLRRGSPRLDAFVERRLRSRIEGLQAQSHQIIQAGLVWKSVHGLLQGLHLLALLSSHLPLCELRPRSVSVDPPARGVAAGYIHRSAAHHGHGIAWRLTGSGVRGDPGDCDTLSPEAHAAVLRRHRAGHDRRHEFEREWALPTYKIVRLLVIVFALVLAYPHIPGSQSEAFKGLTLLIGVIFSLGSTSFIANLIAGYSVIYRRAFKVGDRIRVNEIIGDVTEIRLMVTHLRTIKNEEITVPNSLIIGSHVVNYSRLAGSHGLILHTIVGIGYETPWRQVEAMLRLAAERTPGLLKDPPPFVLQKALGDFAVTYELNVYCDDPHRMEPIYSALHKNILDVFNEYDVQIMTPAYRGDPAQPKLVPKDQWYAAPAEPAQTPAADPRKS